MKKFFKSLLIAIALIAVIFVVGGYLIPSTWSASESAMINASNEAVFEEIANLHNWQTWSPWNSDRDPTQVNTYEGPEVGAGAKMLWTSQKMGKGWLLIKDAHVDKGVSYELFIDMGSMQSTLVCDIAFARSDEGLLVTWTDRGDSGNNLIKRWMSLMIKPMIKKDFKEGLAKLKTIAEEKPAIEKEPEQSDDAEAKEQPSEQS